MSTVTHYTTLGLLPTAAPEVIRATYKALALLCHPDKTVILAARERASHAATFNEVQAAYDVLANPSLKALYDAQLRHRAEAADGSRFMFRGRSSTPKRGSTVKLTTPEEKAAIRAEARQSLEDLRSKRAQREARDAQLAADDLKDMIQTWHQLAIENDVDPPLRAHCVIRIHEYEQKVAEREQEHEEWLARMSTAKQQPSTPTPKAYHTAPDTPKESAPLTSTTSTPSASASRLRASRTSSVTSLPTPQSRIGRDGQRKCEAAERVVAMAARTEARLREKTQPEAVRRTLVDQKVAAVRIEKKKQKAKVELQAQQMSQRIAKARAKAGAAPIGTVGAIVGDQLDDEFSLCESPFNHIEPTKSQTKVQKLCDMCGREHRTFREWRACNTQAAPVSEDSEGAFLRAG